MDWLLFHFTMNTAACGGNKKVRLSPHPTSHLPPENLWVWLRQSLEKAALAGDQFQKNLIVASFYDQARTYFQRNA